MHILAAIFAGGTAAILLYGWVRCERRRRRDLDLVCAEIREEAEARIRDREVLRDLAARGAADGAAA
jgi:hypothetical protein